MQKMKKLTCITTLMLLAFATALNSANLTSESFIDAAAFGFSPNATGVQNLKALQAAVDKGGTITVSRPGTYKLAGTITIGDNTSLVFGNGTIIQKSAENGHFTHVFINKGAYTRQYNHNITIEGLNLSVNGVEKAWSEIYGLRGHISFFYVKDVKLERFRCTDLATKQFCVHICTFEDFLMNDAVIIGDKDGVHFGPGKRFRISNVVFRTSDDALALVPGDWVTANPEYGNLEDGIIENITELASFRREGAFAKIVASGWPDWKLGMKVQQGTAVLSNGRIYRVAMEADSKVYTSSTCPDFEFGMKELDGINWLMFQQDTIHTAAVRNIVFRDIFLYGIRTPFSILSYSNHWEHSYYPGAPMPVQGNISLEKVHMLSNESHGLFHISTPVDFLNIRDCTLKKGFIHFGHAQDYATYPPTYIHITGCTFLDEGASMLIKNDSPGKEIYLKTSGNLVVGKEFSSLVDAGKGNIHIDSDLPGLKEKTILNSAAY